MPLYSIPLPNGVIVDIEGPDTPETAMQAQTRARQYFREAYPEEFETWRQRQVGIGRSATAGTSSAIDQAQAQLYGAAEALGETTNLPGLSAWGRQGRIRNEREAEAAFPSDLRTGILDVEGPVSFGRAATELVTGSLPQTGAAMAGALGGAKLGALLSAPTGGVIAPIAVPVGALLGAAATQFPFFTGSNVQRQTQVEAEQRGVPAEEGRLTSPGSALLAAVPQSLVGGAVDAATLGAAGLLRRAGTQAAESAGASLGQRVLRAGGAGAVGNAIGEPIEQAFERGQAGLSLTDAEAGREYLEAGLGGAVAGGITGGALGGVFGQRPAPPPAAEIGTPAGFQPPTPPAEQPTPRFQPLTLPERPASFASLDEAEAFAADNPQFTPPVNMGTPEASAAFINAARVADWQKNVSNLRQQAIDEFVAAPAADQATPDRQAQASNLLTNLAEAQARGNLDLNSFSPLDIAKSALSVRDIDPGKPSKSEVKSITSQLDELAKIGYIQKTTPRSYSISTTPVVAPAQQEAQATEQATSPTELKSSRHIGNTIVAVNAEGGQPGFTTSKGSTYVVTPEGQTVRTKRSPGRGRGETYAPHNALYVTPENAQDLLSDMQGGGKYRFITVDDTGNPRLVGPDETLGDSPVGLAVFTRDNKFARMIPAERTPRAGLAPVELRYDNEAPAPEAPAPAAPAPEVPPATASQLWQAYALNAGPHTSNPIVRDAREAAKARGRGFARQEFDNFANQYGTAPTPEAKAEVAATFASGVQPSAQTTVTVNGVTRETTPETLQQTVNEIKAEAVQPSEDPVAGPEVTDTTKDRPRIQKQFDDSLNWVLKWFGSPIMSIGNVKPIFRQASDALKQIYTRRQEATTEFGPLLEPLAGLPAESRAKVTLAMQEARSRGVKPDPAAFSQEENAAMESAWKAGQRALDFTIDAYVKTYFDPQNATDPQVRARLEAFQQAKGSKLITDMSVDEVRAASEAGYLEMQRYNRVRDPLFFPQVSVGTHFVAAYEKKPGGETDLARIYFYNPLNRAQKLTGARDPEQRALEFLRQEFPDSNTHTIMARGAPSETDDRAKNVRKDGDFIAHFLQELSKVSNKEGRQVIDRMFKEINKSQMERIFRKNNDVLRAVTPDNAAEYAIDMMPSYFLSLATIQARQYVQDDFARATQPLTPNDRKYWEELRDYATMPGEAYGTARALAFFTFLGFAVDTAAINLTQGPFVTAPRLMRDGGPLASRYYLSALKTALGNFDVGKLIQKDLAYTNSVIDRLKITNPGEVAALELARKQGVFTPLYTNESRGQVSVDTLRRTGFKNPARVAGGINQLADWGGRLMQAVEEFNRVSSFLAAYRMAKANPSVISNANQLDNKQMQTPYDYASSVVFDTQFITAKEDRALVQRFRPEAEVVTQFLSFPLKMIEQYARHGSMMIQGIAKADPLLAKAGALSFFGMMVPLIGVAGIWALPFADSLREIVERLAKAVWGNPVNFKMEMEKLLQGQTVGGQRLAGILNNGYTHEAGIMSLQRRLAIDPLPAQDLLSGSTLALFGPVGGLLEKPVQAFEYYRNGDVWGLASTLLPRAVGNVVKGAQLATEGEMRTIRNTTVIAPSVVQKADESGLVPSSVRQAMGFPPPAFMDERETVARRLELNTQMNKAKERVHAELAQIMVEGMRASQRGDTAKANEAQAKFRQRAIEVMQEDETRPLASRINPQMSAIRDRVIQDFYGRGSPEAIAKSTNKAARPQMIEEQRLLGRMPPAQ